MADLTLEQVLDRLLHPRLGLIKKVAETPVMPGEPDIMIIYMEFQNVKIVNLGIEQYASKPNFAQSAGAGVDRHVALWSAAGEAVERYAASLLDYDSIEYATEAQMRDEARVVTPKEFILFSDEQYSDPTFIGNAYDPESVIGWVRGADLLTKEKVILPALLTLMGYKNQQDSNSGAEMFADSYSTGCAAGPNPEWAICGGLLESIERDCYGLHWAAKHAPPKIDIETALANVEPRVQALLLNPGVEYELMDITNEFGVPCILVYSRHVGKRGVALGCSANLDPRQALEKAIIESNHTLNWVVDLRRWETTISAEDVRTFKDNVIFYTDPEKLPQFNWMCSSDVRSTMFDDLAADPLEGKDHKAQARMLLDRFKELGHPAYVVNMTPEDVASLGMTVLRVITPTLQPMWAGYRREMQDRRRLEKFLKHIGAELDRPVNTDTHPFP